MGDRTTGGVKVLPAAALITAGVAASYRFVVTGRATVDTGWGRTLRQLGPLAVPIHAPRAVVFDVISAPYLARTPRAMSGEIEVLERGADMVLAAHHTALATRRTGRTVATTVETVRFRPPDTVDFRLVRGPVPHVVERFTLTDHDDGTRLLYEGELGADFWAAGRWWGRQVAAKWVETVRGSLDRIASEAERRARHP